MSNLPSPDAFRRNWTESDLPIWQRTLVAMRNNARKMLRGRNCCGNHGEPGC